MSKQRNCKVCQEAVSKYKCPVCFTPYCSLPCYKLHKAQPCYKEEPLLPESPKIAQPLRPFEEGDDESGMRLPRSKLEAVVASDEIRHALKDERLQAIVRRIDSCLSPEKDLDDAMQVPEFREFADKILAVIDPERHSPSLLH
ncbi:hypothetical protein O6H91_11G083100 [Diphasiastrum complanatum]|uniref:Uncharacterized protein n=2 Tax=Diphasiastrum complanatum TaxID=34168 RepID=A0ACC2CB65_DIPCM|nr:hypothetical protein O6H91_11G083100 [Diphasiastrum complanatum]KAJ7539253.1 hypothetical protein O6H91_11G083100 [Diphasiastrum complanatum]